jgi:hypothetical protein
MRRHVVLAGCALVAGITTLVLVVQIRASKPSSLGEPSAAAARAESEVSEATTGREAVPDRNVFEYGSRGGAALSPPLPIPSPTSPPSPLAPALPPPLRLVGLVVRATGTRAALLISGEIAVLGPGQQERGYTVISIDEDTVRVRDEKGNELALPVDSDAPSQGAGPTHQPLLSGSPRS